METKQKTARFIISKHEEMVTWTMDTPKESLQILSQYAFDSLRKKFKCDEFKFEDPKGKELTLSDLVNLGVEELTFISIPDRPHVKTEKNDSKRPSRNEYKFKTVDAIKISKFESDRKFEEVDMKIASMKIINQANSNKNFDPANTSKQIQQVQPKRSMGPSNPFGGSKQIQISTADQGAMPEPDQKGQQLLSSNYSYIPNNVPQQRQKVPVEDGKSQYQFMKLSNSKQEVKQMQYYTLEDLKKHRSAGDCWMALDGKVYDITQYISYHPGGNKIMAAAGKDGTALYNQYHAWVNAEALIGKYLIGFLKR